MRKVFRDCFTGIDGTTFDLLRILWAGGILAPIFCAMLQDVALCLRLRWPVANLPIWTTQDWTTWAAAMSGLMLAGAGALYMKRQTEPSVKVTKTTDDGDGNSSTIEAKS